jgi:hypothetical protein
LFIILTHVSLRSNSLSTVSLGEVIEAIKEIVTEGSSIYTESNQVVFIRAWGSVFGTRMLLDFINNWKYNDSINDKDNNNSNNNNNNDKYSSNHGNKIDILKIINAQTIQPK